MSFESEVGFYWQRSQLQYQTQHAASQRLTIYGIVTCRACEHKVICYMWIE